MHVELKEISSVKKLLKIEVPKIQVEQAWKEALQKIQQKAAIKGFRKGKVPLDLVEKQFPQEVQQETMELLVQKTYPEAVESQKLRPISNPDIKPKPLLAGQPFSYEATIEIFPEVTLKKHEGISVEQEEVVVSAEELDEELKRLQTAMTQLSPAPENTTLEKGIVAKVDFDGKAEGKLFEGSTARGLSVDFGSGQVLEVFEKQLKGAKKGEKRSIEFHYPKDYFNKDLAGKNAAFEVTVIDLHKKEIPEFNDEFAKDLGSYKTFQEVKDEIQKRIRENKEQESKHKLTRDLLTQLIEKNSFDVPETMIQEELRGMLESLAQELKRRNQKPEDLDLKEVLAQYKPEAEFRVRSFLICDSIARDQKFSVLPEELDEHLETVAKNSQQTLDKVREYYEKQNLLGALTTRLLHEKSLEFVRNQAKIKVTKPKSKSKR